MEINFDKQVDRVGTDSAKWDIPCSKYGSDIIPLSVADMDLPAPQEVIEVLNKRNQLGVYGYTIIPDDYYSLVTAYFKRHYAYDVSPEEVVFCPRIIQAISIYIREFTIEHDTICLFTPSYSPILNAVLLNNRKLSQCPLVYQDQEYHIDFEKLEVCFSCSDVFILISPHNPTGLVFTIQDLNRIASLAEKYNVFIISDDIHADFDFSGEKHHIISSVSNYVKENSIICTSPSKTFNLAGLEISNLIIHNQTIRHKFNRLLQQLGFHNPNYFAIPAIKTAYQNCDLWLHELQKYIFKNKRLVKCFFAEHIPELEVVNTIGTYLLWVNYSRLGIDEQRLKYWLLHLSKIEMSWGSDFGEEGDTFFRMNIAVPAPCLIACLDRMKQGFILLKKEGLYYATHRHGN